MKESFLINNPNSKQLVISIIQNLQEGEYLVRVSKRRQSRSLNQNAYYWGVVVKMLAEEFGYDPQDMHEALKYKFLASSIQLENGEFLFFPKQSSELNTIEFEDYLEKIRIWAIMEFNILIPLPHEVII